MGLPSRISILINMELHLAPVPMLQSEHHHGIERNAYQEDFGVPDHNKKIQKRKKDNEKLCYN